MENEIMAENNATQADASANMSETENKKSKKGTGKKIIAVLLIIAVIAAIGTGVFLAKKNQNEKVQAVKDAIEEGFDYFSNEDFSFYSNFCTAYDVLSDKQKEQYNQELVECLIEFTELAHNNRLSVSESNALSMITQERIEMYEDVEEVAALLHITKDEHLDYLQYLDAVQDLERYVEYNDARLYMQSSKWDATEGINKMADAYRTKSMNFNAAKNYFAEAREAVEKNITTAIMVDSLERKYLYNIRAWDDYAESVCNGAEFSVSKFNALHEEYVGLDEKIKSISTEVYNAILNLPDFYL